MMPLLSLRQVMSLRYLINELCFLTSCKRLLDTWYGLFVRYVYYTPQSIQTTSSDNKELHVYVTQNLHAINYLPKSRPVLWRDLLWVDSPRRSINLRHSSDRLRQVQRNSVVSIHTEVGVTAENPANFKKASPRLLKKNWPGNFRSPVFERVLEPLLFCQKSLCTSLCVSFFFYKLCISNINVFSHFFACRFGSSFLNQKARNPPLRKFW